MGQVPPPPSPGAVLQQRPVASHKPASIFGRQEKHTSFLRFNLEIKAVSVLPFLNDDDDVIAYT